LTELLRQARKANEQLGMDLDAEIASLLKQRTFGLVFERHQPEAVDLPGRVVRRGDKVRVLPPRGEAMACDNRLWRIERIERTSTDMAQLVELDSDGEPEVRTACVEDLVVVAEFRDRIYPGLIETGRIEHGKDKPFHTVINSENFHALAMLTYTHRDKIDAIYIDPPYNTGARDWKYNNNYVEGDDDYRHSKWLAFMERRLEIARELLNPDDSVLIVTIDEKEYLRLGMLLEQTFPEARITMVTSSINAAGATRKGTFARAAEYLFFVQFGASRPAALPLEDEWNAVRTKNKQDIYWSRLIRSGGDSARSDSPNQFYPIIIQNTEDGPVVNSIGDTFRGTDLHSLEVPSDCVAVWPIRKDGSEGRWRVSAGVLRSLLALGHVRLGGWREGATTVYYLKQGESKKVLDGVFPVVGNRADGSVITDASEYETRFVPTDVWRITSHDAGNSGSRLISRMIPGRKFPFPKSLYAVEDALRFFLSTKRDATVLDFFSGSGTTAHAVMRLNKEDSGRRQSISVTNNEVSDDEQKTLREKGLRPGDAKWEQLGICDYVTKPRIEAAITGRTPEGEPITGDYRFNETGPMSQGFEENAAFFTLTYEAPLSVRHHRAFGRIAPILWMRAGSQGRMITELGEDGWDVADTYAVLENLDRSAEFIQHIAKSDGVQTTFILTDDDSAFQMICRDLPSRTTPVRLYESYLQNFEINMGRNI
jgi:adenine-specific DNA-methyltransferase